MRRGSYRIRRAPKKPPRIANTGKKNTKKAQIAKNSSVASNTVASNTAEQLPLAPILMGFVRGVSPDTWVERWKRVPSRPELQVSPVNHTGDPQKEKVIADHDILLVRVAEGQKPAGAGRERHTVELYTEKLALVVPKEHELAAQKTVTLEDLQLVTLLDYGETTDNSGEFAYDSRWPETLEWADPSYKPQHLRAALELVKAGLGLTIAPLPLARATLNKRELKAIEIVSDLPSATIFAAWQITRDGNDIQELIGVLRGRGANSSR